MEQQYDENYKCIMCGKAKWLGSFPSQCRAGARSCIYERVRNTKEYRTTVDCKACGEELGLKFNIEGDPHELTTGYGPTKTKDIKCSCGFKTTILLAAAARNAIKKSYLSNSQITAQ